MSLNPTWYLLRVSIRLILISDAVVSFQVLAISPRHNPSIPEVEILWFGFGWPVASILLDYLVDGLVVKAWHLVELVILYWMV